MPAGETVATALQLAERIAQNAPLAPAAVKELVRAADGACEDWAFAVQARHMAQLTASADVREGMTAFTERRSPVWQGR